MRLSFSEKQVANYLLWVASKVESKTQAAILRRAAAIILLQEKEQSK